MSQPIDWVIWKDETTRLLTLIKACDFVSGEVIVARLFDTTYAVAETVKTVLQLGCEFEVVSIIEQND